MPFLPPLVEFVPFLENIWNSKILSNQGPYHQLLEGKLLDYLNVENLSLFNNGTIALATALKALNLTGEVITTPYSFLATTNAITWCGLTPVFVDICSRDLNIDYSKIEAAITPKTTAILAVHCYGYPCNVAKIEAIAKKYQLKVIYDAAHTFGIRCHGESILNSGDVSVLSLHATKVFNTLEGGATICRDPQLHKRICEMRNFGFESEISISLPGLNGKMNEVSAALGVLQLEYIDNAISQRKLIDQIYRKELKDIPGITCYPILEGVEHNYSYFPIKVDHNYRLTRDELKDFLASHDVFTRRYFYPLITDLIKKTKQKYKISGNLNVATKATNQILCLPIYPELAARDVARVAKLISRGNLDE